MKKKKLSLNKVTISNLERAAMKNAKGGFTGITLNTCGTLCFPDSLFCPPTPTKGCNNNTSPLQTCPEPTGPVHAC